MSFSEPIVSKIYYEEIKSPYITICHAVDKYKYNLDQFNITFDDYINGKTFGIHGQNLETLYRKSVNDFNYVLKEKVENKFCKKDLEGYRRHYNGTVDYAKNGKCINWSKVDHELIDEQSLKRLANHNYCRNPQNIKDVEFCYISRNETSNCNVLTCGKHLESEFCYDLNPNNAGF